MKTKTEDGEKTYWIGMTDRQLLTLRFAMGSLLLAKETDLPIATAMERQVTSKIQGAPKVTSQALMWETLETFEAGLAELTP